MHFVLAFCLYLSAAGVSAATTRVAVIGGGVGGTAAAYFLRSSNPSWHIELFERDHIGGRAQEVTLDGRVLELGASIIHGGNHYLLSLARQMNLTLSSGDDTGAAFNIWSGNEFVFGQSGSLLSDLWAIAKRYGVSPLRYKWLSADAGKRFGGIYELQQQGTAFTSPEEWLKHLELYSFTQQSAADFMQAHLAQGPLRYGAGLFIEELAGSINRINYNQRNEQLNALAGLVSYLPAADPEVYSIKEGNAALPRKLAEAAALQELHNQTAVQSVTRDSNGQFMLTLQPAAEPEEARHAEGQRQQQQQQQHPHQPAEQLGPYDAVIIATPLEGSGIELLGLNPKPHLARKYQQTTTTFLAGYLDAAFFHRTSLPDGDVFVTNSAVAPFSVVASKGWVNAAAVRQAVASGQGHENRGPCRLGQGQHAEAHCSRSGIIADESTSTAASTTAAGEVQHSELPGQQQQQQSHVEHNSWSQQQERMPLWKVFSEEPLSWHTLNTLFVNATVVASRSWAAYPRFEPPEKFAPFELAAGLCYNNALENAASAMEVAAVAAKNCALLVQQHLHKQGTAPGVEVV